MPMGWPRAMAPPFTFTFSVDTPRSFIDWTATAANASLISIRSRSETSRPSFLRACRIALDGLRDRLGGLGLRGVVGPRHIAVGADLGDPLETELLRLGLAHHDHGRGT